MAKKIIKFIRTKEPQICDCCQKASKDICISNDKILCKACYYKINQKNKITIQENENKNPQLCVAKKVGVHCNVCNTLVTTYHRFQSGKCICIYCYNKMTESEIKQLQSEKYDKINTKNFEHPYKIKFVQGGNP